MINIETVANRTPQHLFTISISNVENFVNTCRIFDINPADLFMSSVTGQEKQYATFIIPNEITDIRMCYAVQGCLIRLFSSNYKNVATFKKELIEEFVDYEKVKQAAEEHISDKSDSTIDVPYLIEAACFKVNRDVKSGNGAKYVREFLAVINLQYDGKGCYMKVEKRPMDINKNITNLCDDLTYTIDSGHDLVKIHMAINNNDFIRKIKGEKVELINTFASVESKFKRDESDTIESLIADNNGCKILSDIYNKTKKVCLYELRGLAQALCCISGAQKTLSKWLKYSELYEEQQVQLVDHLISRYRRIGYAERSTSCKYFCSTYSECNAKYDCAVVKVTDLLKQKDNTIRKLKGNKSNCKDKETVRMEMQQTFDADLAVEDNKLYVYKCFVGLGKTRMYLEKLRTFIEQEKTAIIAFPSHKLKDDVVLRLRDHLSDEEIEEKVIIVPEIPNINDEFMDEINSYYAVGDSDGAKKFIQNYLRDVLSIKENDNISDSEKQLEDYINVTSNLRDKECTTGKIIFTTHERLFSMNIIEPDIVIIDEDITQSIIKQQCINMDELHALRILEQRLLEDSKRTSGVKTVIQRINYIINAEWNKLYSFDGNIIGQEKVKQAVLGIVSKNRNQLFNSRIVDLLFNSCWFVKGKPYPTNDKCNETVSFVVRRNIPFSCKLFVMSATADFEIYQQLFGTDNIVTRLFDTPKLAASITMRHDYSFSREWFENKIDNFNTYISYLRYITDKQLIKGEGKVERQEKNLPLVVTFKKYEEEFEKRGFDLTLHYGNVTGVDEFRGRNVVVFGTPNLHPSLYALYVNAIFTEEKLDKVPDYKKQLVNNDE